MHPIESKVYISGKESLDLADPNLPRLWFAFGFHVIHRIRSDTTPAKEVKIHDSFHDFYHEFDRLMLASFNESKAVVESMLSNVQIPFSVDKENDQIHWKEHDEENLVLLDSLDDVVIKILKGVVRVDVGHTKAEMIVTIDKHTIISREEFERLFSSSSTFGSKNNKRKISGDVHNNNYDYDFDDECLAIEDSLLNNLDRCPRKNKQKGARMRKVYTGDDD